MIPTLDVDGRVPCQDHPELYGAPDGERRGSEPYRKRIRAARALCVTCPVWQTCRQNGRQLQEQDMWGGEDGAQRAQAGRRPRRRTPSGQNLRGTRPSTAA